MNALTSPGITEINATQAAFTLLAEWLRGWFNGSLHCIGSSAPVQFPAVNIAFGQSDPMQPLYTSPGGLDAEIRVVAFPRSESQESLDTVMFSGKLATDFVLFNFWVSTKHPGGGQSEYSAMRIADLLKAILANPDSRYPLLAGGINTLRPQLPQVIPSTDYHKRLVACSAQLQYAIQFDEQPVPPDGSIPDWPLLAPWGQSIEFFSNDPAVTGNYLLGQYTAPLAMNLVSANVIGWAPQVSPVTLQLEVNGALQPGLTLTLPVGAANVEVSAAVSLGKLAIPRGAVVRWKTISAPASENSAWHIAVEMSAVPQPL